MLQWKSERKNWQKLLDGVINPTVQSGEILNQPKKHLQGSILYGFKQDKLILHKKKINTLFSLLASNTKLNRN